MAQLISRRDAALDGGIKRVCFVGRPNVGKSSLFNRLTGRKQALVFDEPGVTRDVKTARVRWQGIELELADLAGLELTEHRKDPLHSLAMEAALEYLRGADLAVFVVDGRAPLCPGDHDLARTVRASGRDVLPVISKAESDQVAEDAQIEAAVLGFGEAVATSAEHNQGIEALKDAILAAVYPAGLPEVSAEDLEEMEARKKAPRRKRSGEKTRDLINEAVKGSTHERPITIGVYGRPNVGKSTLVNAILGSKRMIVSPIAGTTVDAVDTDFSRDGVHYRMIDTAGIRRRSKTERGVEVLSVVQAMASLPRADVALFVVDGYEGITDQDEKVASLLLDSGRPVIIVINKWDLCRGKREEYAEKVREAVPFLDFAPVMFMSAEKGDGLDPIFDLIPEMLESRMTLAPTGELNRVVQACEMRHNPKNVRIYYSVQVSKNPPTIRVQVSDLKKMHYSLERHISNSLRQRFGWMGSPIRLQFFTKSR